MRFKLPAIPRKSAAAAVPVSLFLFAAIVIGCGGGGGASASGSNGSGGASSGGASSGGASSGGASGGSTTTTTGGSPAVVQSTQPGRLEASFMTGAGRAPTVFVDIDFVRLDSTQSSFSTTRIGLDGFTTNAFPIALSSLSPRSQAFSTFRFQTARMILPGPNTVAGPVLKSMPSSIRLSAGRTTAVKLNLDESMFVDGGGSLLVDDFAFDFLNLDPYGGSLPAFYTDALRFDISNVASRPTLAAGGLPTYLLLTGDLVGMGNGDNSSLEVHFNRDRTIDLEPMRRGRLESPSAGDFQVRQADPRGNPTDLACFNGSWLNYSSAFTGLGTFLALALPSADPTKPDHLVMLAMNGSGQITECYFGTLDATGGTFFISPIGEFKNGSPSQLQGVIVDSANGGTFQIQAGTIPSGFLTSGSYIRYLR